MSNLVRTIRRDVLGLTQTAFSEQLGVDQSVVSRWEKNGLFPSNRMAQVRELGKRLRPDWSDSWLFDPPTDAEPMKEAS